jgi:hypothetical protein
MATTLNFNSSSLLNQAMLILTENREGSTYNTDIIRRSLTSFMLLLETPAGYGNFKQLAHFYLLYPPAAPGSPQCDASDVFPTQDNSANGRIHTHHLSRHNFHLPLTFIHLAYLTLVQQLHLHPLFSAHTTSLTFLRYHLPPL